MSINPVWSRATAKNGIAPAASEAVAEVISINPVWWTAKAKHEFTLSHYRWSPGLDIPGFASILLEVIVSNPAMLYRAVEGQVIIPADVPLFVSELIEAGQ
jgi:hypothetical protein